MRSEAARINPVEAPRELVLDIQEKRLSASAQDVDGCADRLHSLADRLMGPRPKDSGAAGSPTPAQRSAIERLNDAHGWLENSRARLLDAVERLEAL